MLNTLRSLWPQAALAFWTLGALEMPVYLMLLVVPMTDSNLYTVAAGTCVVGMLLGVRHGKDVGRTITQLYTLDLLLTLLLLGVALAMDNAQLPAWAYWAAKTGSIAISLWKILALTSMLAYPAQPGWPTVIPFVSLPRDHIGEPQHDQAVYLGMAVAVLLAGWMAWRNVPYEMAVFAVPMFILILIVRAQQRSVDTGAGRLSELALALGQALDRIPDPEVRAMSGRALTDGFGRIADRSPTPPAPSGPAGTAPGDGK